MVLTSCIQIKIQLHRYICFNTNFKTKLSLEYVFGKNGETTLFNNKSYFLYHIS
jgi:fatty-acid desaturase